MKEPTVAYIRGYIQINVTGKQTESFLNMVGKQQISIWNVQRTAMQVIQCCVLVTDFWQLRPLVKTTGCRIHIQKRCGLPFLIMKIRQRKFLLFGGILFIVGLYMLTSLVWSIEVKGNVRIPTEKILTVAKEQGLYPFQWIFRLRTPDSLAKAIHMQLHDASWIGIYRTGTKVKIQVVEATKPNTKQLMNPRHLIAIDDAVITHIIAERGRAVVARHMRVRKGGLLISGIVDSPMGMKYVAAKGEVRGLVWHKYDISAPFITRHKVYTGQQVERKYGYVGKQKLLLSGFKHIPYSHYERMKNKHFVHWRHITLPFGYLQETVKEVKYVTQKRSLAQAVYAGIRQAREDVLVRYGPHAHIQVEKTLHQRTDNDKVMIRILFEVEQSIVKELPLVHSLGMKIK